MHSRPADHTARQQALDLRHSCIVQAPAGSGKTTLLTWRFLKALSEVEHPRAVWAITFTQKAARHMRERILHGLTHATELAEHHPELRDSLERLIEKNQRSDWNVIQHPERLCIKTIDALCFQLASQDDSEDFSTALNINDNPELLYARAAQRLFEEIQYLEASTQDALQCILKHRDQSLTSLLALFSDALKQRAQWMPVVVGQNDPQALKDYLEQCFERVHTQALNGVRLQCPDTLHRTLSQLWEVSYPHRSEGDTPLKTLPDDLWQTTSLSHRIYWDALARWLMTQEGDWRKTFDKRQGFPSPSTASSAEEKKHHTRHKQEGLALLQTLTDYPDFKEALNTVKNLPPIAYSDPSWERVASLLELLPTLVAHLHVIFQEEACVDFIEVAQRALRALGSDSQPSELQLQLDQELQHLLVDEFQDTSVSQFQLIQRLIQHWSPDDGRTLFLVGDPMQSIYRFRKADVGLFLQAQQQGIAPLYLKPLQLTCNFRSQPELLHWINGSFSKLFPNKAQATHGAVPFCPSVSSSALPAQPAVFWHGAHEPNGWHHALLTIREQHPDDHLAILVRSKSHARVALQQLKQSSLSYQAIGIRTLSEYPMAHDLWAIARWLMLPYDRVAAFACLNMPYVGLTRSELLNIAQYCPRGSLWPALLQLPKDLIPTERQTRLEHFLKHAQHAFESLTHQSLSACVFDAFYHWGGPLYYTTVSDQQVLNVFFKTLQRYEPYTLTLHPHYFENFMTQTAVDEYHGDHRPIEIMTIHKSKGLEFDHVFLMGLEKTTAHDPERLLLMSDQLWSQERSLLMAPIPSYHKKEPDPHYEYLKQQEKKKSQYEMDRLLYVACTRAKKQLHLCADVDFNDSEYKAPKHSFLERLLSVDERE